MGSEMCIRDRDTADLSHKQGEARTDDRGAPAQSSALPSRRASLFEHGSSETSGVVPKQQPQPKQMTDRKEEQHGEQKEVEDQQLVFVEERRRTRQEELVETEQAEESQATSPLQPPPPQTLPPPHATEAEMERKQGKVREQKGEYGSAGTTTAAAVAAAGNFIAG